MKVKGALEEAQLESFATVDLPDPTVMPFRAVWDKTLSVIKISDGAAWVTNTVGDGSITAAKLAADSVITAKILDANVTLAKLEAAITAKLTPTGSILAYGGTSAPTGFLMCDGAAVSRSIYSALFAIIGEFHGEGNNTTTFNVPDYRGRFLRGVDSGQARDPDAAGRTAMGTGGNTGDNVGSIQADAFRLHNHTLTKFTGAGSGQYDLGNNADNTVVNTSNTAISDAGGNETRPVNAGVNFIIKT